MISNPPKDTIMLLESRDIYDGWAAALLSNGDIINRWDRESEKVKYIQTSELIAGFLAQHEPKGFDDEPE